MSSSSILQASEDDLLFLKDQWYQLLDQYSAHQGKADSQFSSLAAHYSGPERFYHNLHHIAELLRLINSLRNKLRNYEAVCFAAWFHDVIYNTRKGDNEEKSAELAGEVLIELKVPLETIDFVRELILATKQHTGDSLSQDARVFLDADLSILGAPEHIYLPYSEAIRKEYAWVPDFLYRRERRKVLQSFVARERIYLTDEMWSRFEAQARQNINNEIASL